MSAAATMKAACTETTATGQPARWAAAASRARAATTAITAAARSMKVAAKAMTP
jgi:hypothetical protein